MRALATAVVLLVALDLLVRASFPTLSRLNDNFSAAYLERTLEPANVDGKVLVLGDSALWGYGLKPQEAAVARLQAAGAPLVNLSYEGGSPPNTYAVLELALAHGLRPKAVFFNVNDKEFNEADSAYETLYPAVETLAWPLLTGDERTRLQKKQSDTFDSRADRTLGNIWQLYGLRADVRELLFDAPDAAGALLREQHTLSGETQREALAHRPIPERFEGTYDLSPLDRGNAGVVFLEKTLALLRARHIAAYVALTPTNHALLHEYIDAPQYRANLDYLARIARAGGAKVFDYDRAFAGADFIDNDHLSVVGNLKLAARLKRDLAL